MEGFLKIDLRVYTFFPKVNYLYIKFLALKRNIYLKEFILPQYEFRNSTW